MSPDPRNGWRWFDAPATSEPAGNGAEPAPNRELARAFARCFGTPEGEAALRHLTDVTLRRALGPDAADAHLRHLEGQRQLVAHIHALVARGRAGN
ncbi:MAG TPA: hypothetical protein VIF14_07255 [Alphaproteobacteria bacterium]|jgi:hypothetical protein